MGGPRARVFQWRTASLPSYESGLQQLYVAIDDNVWYWVTIQYNRTAGYGYMEVYLASTMAKVGSTISKAFGGSPPVVAYWSVGQSSQGGNTEATFTWFGPTIFDWTDGTFPLLLSQPEDIVPGGGAADDRFRSCRSQLVSYTSTRLRRCSEAWSPRTGILNPALDAQEDHDSRVF